MIGQRAVFTVSSATGLGAIETIRITKAEKYD